MQRCQRRWASCLKVLSKVNLVDEYGIMSGETHERPIVGDEREGLKEVLKFKPVRRERLDRLTIMLLSECVGVTTCSLLGNMSRGTDNQWKQLDPETKLQYEERARQAKFVTIEDLTKEGKGLRCPRRCCWHYLQKVNTVRSAKVDDEEDIGETTFDRTKKMGSSEYKMAKKNSESLLKRSGLAVGKQCTDNDSKNLKGTNDALSQDPHAEKLLTNSIRKTVVYKNPDNYVYAKDTHYCESYNNAVLVYVDKRVCYQHDIYKMTMNLATLDWKKMESPGIKGVALFNLGSDQAFIKTMFFAADRASDVGRCKSEQLAWLPKGEGILLNHTYGKTLRDGTSNTFPVLAGEDRSMCLVQALLFVHRWFGRRHGTRLGVHVHVPCPTPDVACVENEEAGGQDLSGVLFPCSTPDMARNFENPGISRETARPPEEGITIALPVGLAMIVAALSLLTPQTRYARRRAGQMMMHSVSTPDTVASCKGTTAKDIIRHTIQAEVRATVEMGTFSDARKCEECGATRRTFGQLKAHIMIHTGEDKQSSKWTKRARFDKLDMDLYILVPGTIWFARNYRNDMLALQDPEEPGADHREFRHAAYRHYVLWQYGWLGEGNRVVIPSCCVWRIRDTYPDSQNHYTGYIANRLYMVFVYAWTLKFRMDTNITVNVLIGILLDLTKLQAGSTPMKVHLTGALAHGVSALRIRVKTQFPLVSIGRVFRRKDKVRVLELYKKKQELESEVCRLQQDAASWRTEAERLKQEAAAWQAAQVDLVRRLEKVSEKRS
ncbi:hypothetical protein Bbelb_035900 [Branchiostoma belcheri]|nr:hypothetical protein Bbelb_035900 [Branchiostoma belcheri]